MAYDDPPTASYLSELQTEMYDRYRRDDVQIDTARAQREMRVPAMMGADEKYTLVNVDPRDPDVSEEGFQQTAMLTLERPKLRLDGGESDTAQTAASQREHWTEETLWQCGSRTPGFDTMNFITDAALNDGGAWSKILFLPDAWDKRYAYPMPNAGESSEAWQHYDKATEDVKKQCGPPFAWEFVDPRVIYPDTMGGRITEVIEVTDRPVRTTFRRYRLGYDADGNIVPEEMGQAQASIAFGANQRPILPTSITMLEHWDETWCFPAGTLVESDSDLVGAYKRWYEGELTTIRTARGHELSGTPNHPVMTEHGWVPLGQLKQGDRVVSRTFREQTSPRYPHPQDRQAPIGQVFGLLDRLGVRQWRVGSAKDFHGDGQDRRVDVVRTERLLWDRVKTALAQPVQHFTLALTDLDHRALVGERRSVGLLNRARTTTNRGVSLFGSRRQDGALFRSHALPANTRGLQGGARLTSSTVNDRVDTAWVEAQLRGDLDGGLGQVEIAVQYVRRIGPTSQLPPQSLSLTLGTHAYTSRFEARADRAVRDAESITDLDTGLAEFDVAVDDVVHVERKQWAGHVYNLESVSHTYSAGGIIVQNCSWCVTGTNRHNEPTGAIVKQFRHGYGFLPYDFAPGLWMNFWRNRKIGWGVSQTKLWLVQYRQYLRAMHAQYVARDLLSPLVTYGDSSAAPVIGDDGKPRDRDPGPLPGEVINLGPGRQLQRINYPDATTLEKHMSLVDNAIRELESPRVTTLSGMEGAGFAISQVLSYQRVRVGPIVNNIQQLLKRQTEKLWDLAQNKVQEKIWVGYSGSEAKSGAGYIGLGPDDFSRPVKISWDVKQELPTDDLIKARYAHERLQAGTWGSDEAIDYLGDNPDEIRRSKARDRIRQSPEYQKWLDQQVFQFAGRGDILGAAAQAQAMAAQIQPTTGNMGPGGPFAPPKPMAPGVFEGGGPGMGGVPDLGALATAPNGAGALPPPGPQVMQGAAGNIGAPGAGGP